MYLLIHTASMDNTDNFCTYANNYIRRTLEGNTIVDHSDAVGASPVGAAPTASAFST